MDNERKKTIEKLKEKMMDGWQMAHDPLCSKGFEAANRLIAQYELDIKILYNQLQLVKEYLPPSAKYMCDFSDFYK